MNNDIVQKLICINRQFYQTFAAQFSNTRLRLQPGVRRILETIPAEANILDLGCGNGELARNLIRRNHTGIYVGLDFSTGLLEYARQTELTRDNIQFLQTDLSEPNWVDCLERVKASGRKSLNLPGVFDSVVAFAFLHHLPGRSIRHQILSQVRALLEQHGRFIHSEWQFLNSPRMRERIVPWEQIGVSQEELDEGDYLLDWRQGGHGLRYVHFFSGQELTQLANETGFEVSDTFFSDGEGGRLGLYQVWKPI